MRTFFSAAAAALAALALTSSASASPPKSAAAKIDWTKVVADTGIGWRMGNPKAPTQLIEYGSFNCSHCAAFATAAMPTIRKQVAAGKMAFEFRPKQIFPHDPSATLLALCAGKAQVFAFTDDYMASAPAVLDKLRAAYKADPSVFEKAGEDGLAAAAQAMARIGDMNSIAQRHGVSAARAAQCLGDKTMIARVEANEKAAVGAGIKSTPTFLVNGKPATIDDVAKLGIPTSH